MICEGELSIIPVIWELTRVFVRQYNGQTRSNSFQVGGALSIILRDRGRSMI